MPPMVALIVAVHLLPVASQGDFGDGGGSDGGGSGGSGSDSDNSNHVTCSANCHSCSRDYTCDVCNAGYVVQGETCFACASGCSACEWAGGCDKCFEGHFMSSGTCPPCASGCAQCSDGTIDGCTTCFWQYDLLRPEGCVYNWPRAIAWYSFAYLVLPILGLWVCLRDSGHQNQRSSMPALTPSEAQARGLVPSAFGQGHRVQTHDEYVKMTASTLSGPVHEFPSGTWKGYYVQTGGRHNVAEFTLEFTNSGLVRGGGQDDIGKYNIAGKYSSDKVAFSKTYIRGSRSTNGSISSGNKGHTVEYRGSIAGTALGAGLRGSWTIKGGGNWNNYYDGSFHLWPAMNKWRDVSAEDLPSFQVAEGMECVVCMDRHINTRLLPCGHIAFCKQCIDRCSNQCPLCREVIDQVLTHEAKPRGSHLRSRTGRAEHETPS